MTVLASALSTGGKFCISCFKQTCCVSWLRELENDFLTYIHGDCFRRILGRFGCTLFLCVCFFGSFWGKKVVRKIWCCRVGAATWKRRARLFSRIIFHFHSVLLVAVCNYSRASNAGLLHNLGISGELAETIRRARFALE